MIDHEREHRADDAAAEAPRVGRPERLRVLPTATVRVGRRARLPGVLVAVTAVFLTLALVKPWAGPARPQLLVQGSYALPSAAPTAAGATAELEAQCGEPLGWTVFTRERWNGRMVRAWRAVEPSVAAGGPLDPAVPLIRVGESISALGYCSPWDADARPPGGVSISAWRIVGRDAEHPAVIALTLESVVPGWPVELGALFGPGAGAPDPVSGDPRASGDPGGSGDPRASGAPGGSGDASGSGAPRDPAGGATWSLGRYVFALRTRDWERWWAVTVPAPQPA